MTVTEIATVLNPTRSAYSNYEQGIRQPDYDTPVKIALFFDVSTDYILGLES